MFFQRGAYDTAEVSRVDSIAGFLQGRRFRFFFIAGAAVAALGTVLVLINNGIISLPTTVSAAPPKTTHVQADPHQGLPIEVPLNKDVGLTLYRNPATKDKVVSFYTNLAGSPEIARIIIRVANRYNVPLSLAFALAWKESKFVPTAVNYNGNSVDRGLYQLNSLSFPNVTSKQFFDPTINAEKGLGYLSQCLKDGGNEVVGLAMYNAGMSRVYRDGTPRVTLDYISTILKYQDAVITEFQSTVLKQPDVVNAVRQKGNL